MPYLAVLSRNGYRPSSSPRRLAGQGPTRESLGMYGLGPADETRTRARCSAWTIFLRI